MSGYEKPEPDTDDETDCITKDELQSATETIVKAFYHQTEHDLTASERFDDLVRSLLKIDRDQQLLESWSDSCSLGTGR